MDRKISRSSGRKESADGPVKAMQMLNVYSCDTGMCVSHKVIEEKTNEISAAQEVLGLMDLKGMVVFVKFVKGKYHFIKNIFFRQRANRLTFKKIMGET